MNNLRLCQVGVSVLVPSLLFTLQTQTQTSASCESLDQTPPSPPPPTKYPKFQAALSAIRVNEKALRAKWEQDEEGWSKLPARCWPPLQPDADALDTLTSLITTTCASSPSGAACQTSKFNLGTCLIFNSLDPIEGTKIYEDLAVNHKNVDAMVGAGISLLEGFGGVTVNVEKGVAYLQQACELEHPQGYYELGVLAYTGGAAPLVEEDEKRAFTLFYKSAVEGKLSYAEFMVADLISERSTVSDEDRAEAVGFMLNAAEKGHRFARMQVGRMLEGRHKLNMEEEEEAEKVVDK